MCREPRSSHSAYLELLCNGFFIIVAFCTRKRGPTFLCNQRRRGRSSGLLWISCSERKLYRKYRCKSWGPLKSAAGAETGMTPGSFISMTQCHPCHHRLPRKYSRQHCATGRKYLSSKKIFKRVKVNIYLSSLSSHPCLRYRPIWSLATSLLCVQAETHRDF